jgi:putative tricarboxylic transport membrane protein
MEENFRRAMTISEGDPTIFVTRPISLGLLLVTALLLVLLLAPGMKRARKTAFQEEK